MNPVLGLIALAVAFPAMTEPVEDCGAPRRLSGIDVSSFQGPIDWRRVRAAGIDFAFARVSDGLDVVDEVPHTRELGVGCHGGSPVFRLTTRTWSGYPLRVP